MAKARHAMRLGAALLVLGTPASAAAADYYVSPSGSDGGPGSSAEPWATLQHAADAIAPGDAVHVRAGTYEEHVVIQVTGTANAPVVFAAEPGETVVVDGQNVTLPDWGGLVWVRDSSYVTVSGFRVQTARPHDVSAGIFVTGSDHVTIEDNQTYDTQSSGIGVWGSEQVTVRNNEIELACN
ncbi:MAG: right-handed parallel beta-helix repeat-containing protein, partial [Deltaproteobacteria bacterium]|nr:right-handed parallel beta-helix repeat-containing protein [Deltaproteobacteria bacterium]MBW2532776.1 right-handed parallel beta-helix repeat-containing protein [Deltaproteobacteria bacterium]